MQKLILGLLLLAGGLCYAEETSSHHEAAADLYRMMFPREIYFKGFSAMFNPHLDALRRGRARSDVVDGIEQAFNDYVAKIVEDPELDDEMISVYRETFSEAEIRALLEFYSTPVGRKVLRAFPELLEDGARIGWRLAKEYEPEFQQDVHAVISGARTNAPVDE